jgi:flavin-binding protein dodecin
MIITVAGTESVNRGACPYVEVREMVQKIIEIVGISDKNFAKAADNAIEVAAKTVREIRWGRVSEMECKISDDKIVEYRVLMRLYFEVES